MSVKELDDDSKVFKSYIKRNKISQYRQYATCVYNHKHTQENMVLMCQFTIKMQAGYCLCSRHKVNLKSVNSVHLTHGPTWLKITRNPGSMLISVHGNSWRFESINFKKMNTILLSRLLSKNNVPHTCEISASPSVSELNQIRTNPLQIPDINPTQQDFPD